MNGTSVYTAKSSPSCSQMWKSMVGHKAGLNATSVGGHTHAVQRPQNDISEQGHRWADHREQISVSELRQKVSQDHVLLEKKPGALCRPGGIFGLERNHINKVPLGHKYAVQMEGRSSQAETVVKTGGRVGMRNEQAGKLTVELKSKDHLEKHVQKRCAISASSKGLGRMFSVQKLKEKVDKAPERKNYRGEVEKTESQREFPRMSRVENEKIAAYRSNTGISEKQKPQKEHVGMSDSNMGTSAFRANFENLMRTLAEDSRRRVEEDGARRKRKEQQQQTQTDREAERQRPPLVLNRGKTSEVFDVLNKVTHKEPLKQRQQVTGGPGPAGGHLAHNSEGDGDYEDMAPVQDESDYEDLTRHTSAVATYSYHGEDEDEISFGISDVITNIEMVSEAWWRGYCHGRFGYFPASFVQVFHRSTTRIH